MKITYGIYIFKKYIFKRGIEVDVKKKGVMRVYVKIIENMHEGARTRM